MGGNTCSCSPEYLDGRIKFTSGILSLTYNLSRINIILFFEKPFLVGIKGSYLSEMEKKDFPVGVVFVDLDVDAVHFDVEEDNDSENTPVLSTNFKA